MRVFASDDKKRAILCDDDLVGIVKSYGYANVLGCDPAGFIEEEGLNETDERFMWDDGETVSDLINWYGITKAKLGYMFDIPYSTIVKWTRDEDSENYRECPKYVVKMMHRLLDTK